MDHEPIIWETEEYFHRQKTSDWYWGVGIVAVSAAVISILYKNVLFALLLLIGAFSLVLAASKKPRIVRFEINNTGVIIDKTLYPFGTLDSFWVINNEHVAGDSKIMIKSRKMAVPMIIIPIIDEVSSEEIRNFLLGHLIEEEHQESLSQKILEVLGF